LLFHFLDLPVKDSAPVLCFRECEERICLTNRYRSESSTIGSRKSPTPTKVLQIA
jgi:hypothetical protein